MTAAEFYARFRAEVAKVLVGQEEAVRLCGLALTVGGHVLLEGVPGVGKTLLAKTIATALDLDFRRVQFTPDLLPADIVGISIYDLQSREFRTRQGPVFTNVLLADEINRAPAKVQSALLEAMEERGVTLEGTQTPLPAPFLVLATQNPIEYEGTYPLPEAQQDRFLFKVTLPYPAPDQEVEMLRRWGSGLELRDPRAAGVTAVLSAADLEASRQEAIAVTFSDELMGYVVQLATATRQAPELMLGASPRGEVLLMQAAKASAAFEGRDFATPDDVKAVVAPTFRHRLLLRPEAEVAGHTADSVLNGVLASVTPPR